MSAIKEYIWAVFLQNPTSTANLPAYYVTKEEIELHALRIITETLGGSGYPDHESNVDLATRFFEGLLQADALQIVQDDLAGAFYLVEPSKAVQFRNTALEASEIHGRSVAVGAGRFFNSAFQRFYEALQDEQASADVVSTVPASDRIVTLSDNQVLELDTATTEIIDAVTSQNQIGESPGLRELFLGQLKAGRELIRSGSAKAYLIQITLIDTLVYLAKRYENEVIGGLAAALVEALLKYFGIVS